MKKYLSMLLALVLALGLMAGCMSDDAAPSAGDRLENLNLTGLPIVNEPIDITVMTMRWGDMTDSFAQNPWIVDLAANSNVNVEWIVRSSNDWTEQRSIMYASGDLPDVFFGNWTVRDEDVINNIEYFLPLNDLIENYMPNYKKALETYPVMRAMTTHPDGNIYTLAKNLPARPTVRNQPVINKVWLDNLGLEIPTTYQELADVLVAFAENDASGTGRTYGFSHYTSPSGSGMHIEMLNPFGITDINEVMMSVVDGEAFFYPTNRRYFDAIVWLNDLYVRGGIDPESFTQDFPMLTGKRLNAEGPVIGIQFPWTPDAIMGIWADQYVAIPPLAGPYGTAYAGGDPDGVFSIMRNEAAITVFNQNPEATARWIDQFYTNEATIQNFWGGFGVVLTAHADGTYTLNEPPEGVGADRWYWDSSLRDFGPGFVEPGFSDLIKLDPTGGDGFKLEIAKMAEAYVTVPFPALIYTAEETEELTFLQVDINAYVNQTQARWITQGGIEAEWDDYIAQLNLMGLERLIEIRLAAYERSK
ncbi:MAG: extracellular solute-binding protein [Defluviitaleaceae bacterium]|nr:extracellular solute-binding protein [Defluviitaleaceae bacterium]MCL2836495.1 extracellular solute-binding protein [Defluviitaleaceae bacterium]